MSCPHPSREWNATGKPLGRRASPLSANVRAYNPGRSTPPKLTLVALVSVAIALRVHRSRPCEPRSGQFNTSHWLSSERRARPKR